MVFKLAKGKISTSKKGLPASAVISFTVPTGKPSDSDPLNLK